MNFKPGDRVMCIDDFDTIPPGWLERGTVYIVSNIVRDDLLLKEVSLSWHKRRFKLTDSPYLELFL